MHRRQPYRPVNPLTGLRGTRAAAVSYRALAPGGAGRSYGISAMHSLARHSATQSVTRGHDQFLSCGGTPSDHCSLITAHYRYASPDGDGGHNNSRLDACHIVRRLFLFLLLCLFIYAFDSSFHAMIAPYIHNGTEIICVNDTSVYENMAFPNVVSDLDFQSYLKKHNKQLNPIVRFEKKHSLCYRISNLVVVKKTNCYVCLFYINAAWDHSRSLVYAVYDLSGKELYSQLLSSEDKLLGNNDGSYRQTAYSLDNNILSLWIYYRDNHYYGPISKTEHFRYQIADDGVLR